MDQIRRQAECTDLLTDFDHQGLLSGARGEQEEAVVDLSDEELLDQLGVSIPQEGSLTDLRHVKSRAEVRAAEEIANRTKCEDFAKFKPVLDAVQEELDSGVRDTRPFRDDASISEGNFFILSGQKVYVAKKEMSFIRTLRVERMHESGPSTTTGRRVIS